MKSRGVLKGGKMSAKILIITIATAFLGTQVTMAQSVTAADSTQNTAIDANSFGQFQSFVKSKAPENLDAAGVQTFLDGVTDYIYGYSLLAIAMTERVATTVPGLFPQPASFSKERVLDEQKSRIDKSDKCCLRRNI